ncbi:MAG: NAD-dependent epimerase/dehydratase family protein [Candidatus Micrarchaeota archaeon]|nr:NAD-dependent epimerase/dehydratase family protein [Candidatus Micrarchaeota archaeon]
MRIAVLGSTSRFAKYLSEYIEYTGFSRSNFSYTQEDASRYLHDYDVIIMTQGITRGKKDEIWRANVESVERVIEGLRDDQKIIFLSSIAVYGRRNYRDYTEDSPAIPNDPYGESKLIGEKLILESSNPYLIMRVGTMYGEHYNEYINMIKLWKDRGPFYFGDGKNLVPFTYARDVARFLRDNLRSDNVIVNVTSEGISFMDVIESVRQVFNIKSEPVPFREIVEREIKYPFISKILSYVLEYKYTRRDDIYPITLSRSFRIDLARRMGFVVTEFRESLKCFQGYV